MRRDRGVTLIELVIVMLVISIGLVGLAGLFSNTATSLTTNETIQQATQYAQGCAEKAITTRRNLGFEWFAANTFSCNPATNFTFTPLVGALYTGNGSPCPSGTLNCRDISITVTSTPNPQISASITLMLVKY